MRSSLNLYASVLALLLSASMIPPPLVHASDSVRSTTSPFQFDPPDWAVDPTAFEHSMIVIGRLSFDGEYSSNANDRVAAFVDGEVRGVSSPVEVDGAYVFLMLVMGNETNDTVTFQAYDATLDITTTLSYTTTFQSNATVGDVDQPEEWSVSRPWPGQVVQQAPLDGAKNVDLVARLSWSEDATSLVYEVQVSESTTFTSLLFSASGLTDTQVEVQSLELQKTYYWRVRGVSTSADGSWSETWSFSTGSVAPGQTLLLTPADNATNQPTQVSLTWAAADGASSYELAVSLDSDFSSIQVARTGLVSTSATVDNLQGGQTYFWRVRGINSSGSGAWSDAFRFTVAANVLGPPSLLEPQNNSVQDATVSLSWSALSGASTYEYQVSLAQDFSSVVQSASNLSGSLVQISGLNQLTTYYWRVRGFNTSGPGSWSEVRSFNVRALIPDAPTLVSPADAAEVDNVDVWLIWLTSTNASTYRVQVSTSVDFVSVLFDSGKQEPTTYLLESLDHATTYYWRVRAGNEQWDGPWSDTFRFTTPGLTPSAPVLLTPPDGATDQPTRVWLSWQSVSSAESYQVQMATNEDFSPLSLDVTINASTVYEAVDLAEGSTYYWRVRGINASGEGEWSSVNQLTTAIAPPGLTVPLSPANQAIDQPAELVLSWLALTTATGYDVQLSLTPDFSALLVNETNVSTSTLQVSSLPFGRVLYWRVRAVNAGGASSWSVIFSFTTIPAVASSPLLLAPANGSEEQPTSLWLIWQAVEGADQYHLQVASDADFTIPLVDLPGITATQFQLSGLSGQTTYFWRVRGTTTEAQGPWSDPFRFTTSLATSIERTGSGTPTRFELIGNFPNPFNPTTRIAYTLPERLHVRLEVFDVQSRLVGTLVDHVQAPGEYSVGFDAAGLPTGVYIYRLVSGGHSATGKMVLLK